MAQLQALDVLAVRHLRQDIFDQLPTPALLRFGATQRATYCWVAEERELRAGSVVAADVAAGIHVRLLRRLLEAEREHNTCLRLTLAGGVYGLDRTLELRGVKLSCAAGSKQPVTFSAAGDFVAVILDWQGGAHSTLTDVAIHADERGSALELRGRGCRLLRCTVCGGLVVQTGACGLMEECTVEGSALDAVDILGEEDRDRLGPQPPDREMFNSWLELHSCLVKGHSMLVGAESTCIIEHSNLVHMRLGDRRAVLDDEVPLLSLEAGSDTTLRECDVQTQGASVIESLAGDIEPEPRLTLQGSASAAPHCSAGIELVTRPAPQAPEAPDPAAAGGRMDESERELMSDLNLQLAMFSNLSVRDRDSQ